MVIIGFYSKDTYSLDDRPDLGTVLFIGDSYGAGYLAGGEEYGWINKTINKYPVTSYYKAAAGGSGFDPAMDGAIKWKTDMRKFTTTVEDKDKVKWIIILGGLNDISGLVYSYDGSTNETVKENRRNTIVRFGNEVVEMARENFTNAQIAIGVPEWSDNEGSKAQILLDDVAIPAYRKIATDNNGLYISELENVLRPGTGLFNNDHIHPKAEGHELIANALTNYLSNNTLNIVYHRNTSSSDTTTYKGIYITGLPNQKLSASGFQNGTKTLSGWSTQASGTTATYTNNATITDNYIKNHNIVHVYAVWDGNGSTTSPLDSSNIYTATFKNGSTTVDTKTCEIANGSSKCFVVTPSAISKSGYTFTGWGTSQSCTSGTSAITNLEISGNVTLYACYSGQIITEPDPQVPSQPSDDDIVNPQTGSPLIWLLNGIAVISLGIIVIAVRKFYSK